MIDRATALRGLGSKAAASLEAFLPERAAAIERAEQAFLQGPAQVTGRLTRGHVAVFAGILTVTVFWLVSSLRPKPLLSFRIDSRVAALARSLLGAEHPIDGVPATR